MIRAGDMRHVVSISQRTSTQDDAGEPLEQWTTVITRRAAVQRTPGGELFASAARQGRVPTVFRMRYPVDLASPIGPEMRLIWGTAVYDIVSATDPSGRKEELIITATERLGEAP